MENNVFNKYSIASALFGAGVGLALSFKKENKVKVIYALLGATSSFIGYSIGEYQNNKVKEANKINKQK